MTLLTTSSVLLRDVFRSRLPNRVLKGLLVNWFSCPDSIIESIWTTPGVAGGEEGVWGLVAAPVGPGDAQQRRRGQRGARGAGRSLLSRGEALWAQGTAGGNGAHILGPSVQRVDGNRRACWRVGGASKDRKGTGGAEHSSFASHSSAPLPSLLSPLRTRGKGRAEGLRG